MDPTEMPAVCCGPGDRVWSGNPEEATAPDRCRGREIRWTGAGLIGTSCPFCGFPIMGHTDRPVKQGVSVLPDGYRMKDRKGAGGPTAKGDTGKGAACRKKPAKEAKARKIPKKRAGTKD